MSQWYYVLNGEKNGPISREQLLSLFSSGQLLPDTQVCTQELPELTSAINIEGLISPGTVPISINATPPATAELTQKSVTGPKTMFLYIPISRLIWMYIISFGIYEAYWIYKNYQYLKERDGLKIQPFWRGIFGIIFAYSLFKAIRNDREAGAIRAATFSAGWLAAGWVILSLCIEAHQIFAEINIFMVPICCLMILFFVPIQNYINKVNQTINPTPTYYNLWSFGHIVCMIIGIIRWSALLLILLGMMLKK